jgi:hypothetical protein
VKFEVEESRRQIAELVGKPCETFAYPAGFLTEEARSIVAHAGYLTAFSTVYGPTDKLDLHALNRVEILRSDRLLFQFSRKVMSLITRP